VRSIKIKAASVGGLNQCAGPSPSSSVDKKGPLRVTPHSDPPTVGRKYCPAFRALNDGPSDDLDRARDALRSNVVSMSALGQKQTCATHKPMSA